MAALQITVGGSAQNVTALYIIEDEILDATTFAANTFQLNNKYNSLIETGPVITDSGAGSGGGGGVVVNPESWA